MKNTTRLNPSKWPVSERPVNVMGVSPRLTWALHTCIQLLDHHNFTSLNQIR